MHMADALISTPVALTTGAAAAALIGVAGVRMKKTEKENIIPLMGIMGAFIFAAQMINFSIPGTGSSGHIIGGVLLASLLGPWAAFLTLSSVLIIQCLIFADGGLLALGCNILNMGATTCLMAYPLIMRPLLKFPVIMRPLLKFPASPAKIFAVSILACVIGLEAGAVLVTAETELSGITALPARDFLSLMAIIHLAIGVGEGIATGAVILFIEKTRPDLLNGRKRDRIRSDRMKKTVIIFAIAAAVTAGGLSFFASSDPDGLEWSIEKITGTTDIVPEAADAISRAAESTQQTTSIMPDYNNSFAGIIGACLVLLLVWAISSIIMRRHPAVRRVNR